MLLLRNWKLNWQLLGNGLSNKIPLFFAALLQKPLFATTWQKVLTPKTLAYCKSWQLLGNGLSNKFPSSLPHYCKKIYKLFYFIINLSVILPQSGNCPNPLFFGNCNFIRGCKLRAWGGNGGVTSSSPPEFFILPPQKVIYFILIY
jgi:hypothetical protein